jgi:cytochrome c oxidase assembly protein subunit 15
MRERVVVTPERFTQIVLAAVVGLTAIIFTGAAVRLTGSGLGCPTWPRCTETSLYTPLSTHGVIEFGNRLLTFVVGFAAVAPLVAIWFRRPYRRDLMLLSVLLPVGVVAQAVLGGISVRTKLAPGFVMGHYGLSLLILVAAVGLWWRAREEPYVDRPGADRLTILVVRAVFVLGVVGIALGTAATAAGPHAGGSGTGDQVARLTWDGANTLSLMVHVHSYVNVALGLAVVVAWWLARTRSSVPGLRAVLTRLALLMALQGVVGIAQYQLELPAEMVWVHVVLATLTWVGLVRAWAFAGPLPARGRPAPEEPPARAGERVAARV